MRINLLSIGALQITRYAGTMYLLPILLSVLGESKFAQFALAGSAITITAIIEALLFGGVKPKLLNMKIVGGCSNYTGILLENAQFGKFLILGFIPLFVMAWMLETMVGFGDVFIIYFASAFYVVSVSLTVITEHHYFATDNLCVPRFLELILTVLCFGGVACAANNGLTSLAVMLFFLPIPATRIILLARILNNTAIVDCQINKYSIFLKTINNIRFENLMFTKIASYGFFISYLPMLLINNIGTAQDVNVYFLLQKLIATPLAAIGLFMPILWIYLKKLQLNGGGIVEKYKLTVQISFFVFIVIVGVAAIARDFFFRIWLDRNELNPALSSFFLFLCMALVPFFTNIQSTFLNSTDNFEIQERKMWQMSMAGLFIYFGSFFFSNNLILFLYLMSHLVILNIFFHNKITVMHG